MRYRTPSPAAIALVSEGIRQLDVAERLGRSRTYVTKALNGDRPLHPEFRLVLVDLLDGDAAAADRIIALVPDRDAVTA